MPKKKPMEGKPETHPDLDGLELGINEFGEITTNMNIDKINQFLNTHVNDKKFRDVEKVTYAKKGGDDDIDEDDDDDDVDDDDDSLDEFDDDGFKDDVEDAKAPYEFDDSKHKYEDVDAILKGDEKGTKGKRFKDDDTEKDDFDDEEFLDQFAEEFGEEDNYNFDDADDTEDRF
jgi:hypothetical protein